MHTIRLLAALSGAANAASTSRISDYINAGIDLSSEITASQETEAVTTNSSASIPTSDQPCALVAEAWAAGEQYLNATQAYDCLYSVPLNATGAAFQLQGVEFFLQFQSTLEYLANPPPGYLYPAVDLLDGLQQLEGALEDGYYTSEYQFQLDLFSLISSAYDGHLYYGVDMITAFIFSHNDTFVSVSEDGFQIPRVYLWSDLQWLMDNNGSLSDGEISPVVTVDGDDVEMFLNQFAVLAGRNQDPDANYNHVLTTDYLQSYLYTGDFDNITFANGTTGVIPAFAYTNYNLTGVVDGQSFLDMLLANATNSPEDSSTQGTPTTTELPFKPVKISNADSTEVTPFIMTADQQSMAGFFADYISEDLAILKIMSFDPIAVGDNDPFIDFSNTVREFLATCQAANKSKLLLDLQDNRGGMANLGYDLFAQLFPDITPAAVSNFRASDFLDQFGEIITANFTSYTDSTAPSSLCDSLFVSGLNPTTSLRPNNGTAWPSWADFYGPVSHHGGNFTHSTQVSFDRSTFGTQCQPISNHGNLSNITPAVFQAQNIIILTDGFCASTCADFATNMKTQAQVPLISIGGRAQPGPMQAIGSTKGAQEMPWETWAEYILAADSLNQTDSPVFTAWNETLGDIGPGMEQTLLRAANSGLNLRNNLRPGDMTAMPLQFVYQAADCRLFYTATSRVYGAVAWAQAYTARWIDGLCVAGSTGHPSALPDSDLLIAPPDSALNFFGADPTALNPFS